VTPANRAATTMPDKKTIDRATSPAGAHRTEAITTPTSRMPAAVNARRGASWTATVKSATNRATSPGAGTATSHWTSATTTTIRNTALGARRLHARGTTSASWRSTSTGRWAPNPSGKARQNRSTTAATRTSLHTPWVLSQVRNRSHPARRLSRCPVGTDASRSKWLIPSLSRAPPGERTRPRDDSTGGEIIPGEVDPTPERP
jgi:hypothetical protein